MQPELIFIFTGGLLGSAHCIGMCGPFALSIGAATSQWRSNFARQSVFSLGRIATYTSAGAIAGYFGLNLSAKFSGVLPVQALLALVAGVLLIAQGFNAAGFFRRTRTAGLHPCLLPRFLAAFLHSPGLMSVFLAGVFTGFMPCGLVYAFLALASASAKMLTGASIMFAFGLGTMPIMIATGLGGGAVSLTARRQMMRAAAWAVVFAGMVSVVRGASFLESAFGSPRGPSTAACPFCGD